MTEEISRHLLEVLRLFEKAQDKKSWSDISFATSALRDVMEEVPSRKPLPWEEKANIAIGDTDEYRKGYADGIQEITDYFNNFGQ